MTPAEWDTEFKDTECRCGHTGLAHALGGGNCYRCDCLAWRYSPDFVSTIDILKELSR
jgi:hypothetical protein